VIVQHVLRRYQVSKWRNTAAAAFVILCASICGCSTVSRPQPPLQESQVSKVSIASSSLKKSMNVTIYLPKGYSSVGRYPVLYMLHGYSDNEDKWMPILGLQDRVTALVDAGRIVPLIIVMPQIDNSFALNTDAIKRLPSAFSSGKYEDYLIKELIPYIDAHYRTDRTRKGRSIGGLSMGGWAALHLAFSHVELFGKVGGHSPALIDDDWLYPNFDARQRLDPVSVASDKDLRDLKVYLDCGDQDSFKFYEGCDRLNKALQAKNRTSEYHLNPGGHNDAYWKEHLDDYLLFYAGL
jgi:enterochelin esterase-like enzyme